MLKLFDVEMIIAFELRGFVNILLDFGASILFSSVSKWYCVVVHNSSAGW